MFLNCKTVSQWDVVHDTWCSWLTGIIGRVHTVQLIHGGKGRPEAGEGTAGGSIARFSRKWEPMEARFFQTEIFQATDYLASGIFNSLKIFSQIWLVLDVRNTVKPLHCNTWQCVAVLTVQTGSITTVSRYILWTCAVTSGWQEKTRHV